jgi:multidrug resistance efflux pump
LAKIFKNSGFVFGLIIVVLVGAVIAYFWVKSNNSKIFINQAAISAPEIDLTAPQGGTLEAVYVNEGDDVAANAIVARVHNALIKTNSAGRIITINGGIGRVVAQGETIAILINPSDLRVVGQVPENKGLTDIAAGQNAYFTVDAFGSQKFYGTVSEISPTANTGNVAFQTTGSRQTQNFEVKVQYDASQYPEFKNGMSARIWIIK